MQSLSNNLIDDITELSSSNLEAKQAGCGKVCGAISAIATCVSLGMMFMSTKPDEQKRLRAKTNNVTA